jgi:hypothetical protein
MSDASAEAKRAWVESVLGVRFSAPPGAVQYAKLLLRWRQAQQGATQNLEELRKTLLALPEVKADPRLSQVERAVAGLPKLLPEFGETLADHLDAAANGGPEKEQHVQNALATLAKYRALLNAVPVLGELEGFARRRLGAEFRSVSELSDALGELERALAARG